MSEQNSIAIRFKNVCKTYRLYTSSRRRLLGLFFKSVPHKTKHAVVDMNLTVERGEAVAILGRNGAGKSTMLKMITGVTFPTSGEIYVNGIVSALLELTSGFDQEFTGRGKHLPQGPHFGPLTMKTSQSSSLPSLILQSSKNTLTSLCARIPAV